MLYELTVVLHIQGAFGICSI